MKSTKDIPYPSKPETVSLTVSDGLTEYACDDGFISVKRISENDTELMTCDRQVESVTYTFCDDEGEAFESLTALLKGVFSTEHYVDITSIVRDCITVKNDRLNRL